MDGNPVLSKLAKLDMCSQGLAFYYQLLLDDSDVVLRIAALISLVESGTLRRDQWPLLLENMSHGAIRKRAFRFFMDRNEYVFAKKAMENRFATQVSANT